MRPKLGSFSRYRPRVLTLIFLAAIAAMIVLANLSEEFSSRKVDPRKFNLPPPPSELEFDLGESFAGWRSLSFTNMSFGWPLLWRQYVFAQGRGVLAENYSAGRLAGNLAIWLALIAIPAAICEWLLRRYRPRPRFSLRSMLVLVAMAAMLCGWFCVDYPTRGDAPRRRKRALRPRQSERPKGQPRESPGEAFTFPADVLTPEREAL